MITSIAICCFAVACMCGVYRLLIGPRLADRIAALDVALISLMGAITASVVRTKDNSLLILLPVIAIIGFTATVAVSRFIELESVPANIDNPSMSKGNSNDR